MARSFPCMPLPDTTISDRCHWPTDVATVKRELKDVIPAQIVDRGEICVMTERLRTRKHVRLLHANGTSLSISEDTDHGFEEKRIEFYLDAPEDGVDYAELIFDVIHSCIIVDAVRFYIFRARDPNGFHKLAMTISIPLLSPPVIRQDVSKHSSYLAEARKYALEKEKVFWNKYQQRTTLVWELLRQIK